MREKERTGGMQGMGEGGMLKQVLEATVGRQKRNERERERALGKILPQEAGSEETHDEKIISLNFSFEERRRKVRVESSSSSSSSKTDFATFFLLFFPFLREPNFRPAPLTWFVQF